MAAADPEATTTRQSTTKTQNGDKTIESTNDSNSTCAENNCDRYNGSKKATERVQQWNRAIPEEGYITLGTIRYGVRLSTRSSPSPKRKIPLVGVEQELSHGDLHHYYTGNVVCPPSRVLERNRSNSPSALHFDDNKSFKENKVNRCDSNSSTTSSNYNTCCCIGTTVSLPSWKINTNLKNCCSDDSTNRKTSAAKNRNSSSQVSSLSSSESSFSRRQKKFPRSATQSNHLTTNLTTKIQSKSTIPRLSATLDPEIIELDTLNINNKSQQINDTKFEKMSNISYTTTLDTTTPTLTTSKLQIPTTIKKISSLTDSSTTDSTTTINFKENENNFLKGKYTNFHDTLIDEQIQLQEKQHQQHRCYIPQKVKHVSELCQICSTNTINSISSPCTAHTEQLKNNQYHNHYHHHHHHDQQINKKKYVAIHKNSSCCRREKSSEESVLVESLIPLRELYQTNNKTIPNLSVKNSTNSKSSISDDQHSIQSITPISKICEIGGNNNKDLNNSNKFLKKSSFKSNNREKSSNIPRAILHQTLDNSQNLIKLSNFKKRCRRLSPPPPVPPKPYRQQIVRSKSVDSQNENNYNSTYNEHQLENEDHLPNDPLNIRRKILKFEQKSLNFQQHSPVNRFEFFNCFSSNNNNNNNKNFQQQFPTTIVIESSAATINPSPISFGEINDANQSIEWKIQQQQQQYKQNGENRTLLCNKSKQLKDKFNSDRNNTNIYSVDNKYDIVTDNIQELNEFSTNKTISQSSSDSQLRLYCNDSETNTTAASVVIRKFTPKLTKKSFNNNNTNCCTSKNNDSNCIRGDSEDRLIANQEENVIDQTVICQNNNNNSNNNNNNCDNCRDRLIIVHSNNNNNNNNDQDELINTPFYEDDSDIGFIDSSGDNNDQCSSSISSDFDSNLINDRKIPINIKNLSKSERITNKTDKNLNLNKSVINSEILNKNHLNLSFDSVTKKYNESNIKKNAIFENYKNIKNDDELIEIEKSDDFNENSLSDYDTSTISFLSDDNINCGCNLKINQNINQSLENINNNNNNNNNNNSNSSFSSQKSNSEFEFINNNCYNNHNKNNISGVGDNNNLCCCSERVKRFCRELQNQEINQKLLIHSNISNNNNNNNNKSYFWDIDFDNNFLTKSPTLPLPSIPTPFPPPHYPTTLLRSSSTGETSTISSIINSNINRNNNRVRGPLIKRIPAIESFGHITNCNQNQQQQENSAQNKEIIMEKRRNTLDRLQRLGFGRRSTPSPTQSTDKSKKSSEKSERLKELTELLKGNRCSPTPPPVPPPRKPRSQSNSFDKPEKPPDPGSSTPQSPLRAADSDEIIAMDEEDGDEGHIPVTQPLEIHLKPNEVSVDGPVSAPLIPQKSTLYQALRPNTSVSNLEAFLFRRNNREMSKSPPPVHITNENDVSTKLQRSGSRNLICSNTTKDILYRSASFSQVDYSSGKYIKSTLNALRDKFRRDKSNRQQSVIDNANLTLPRKKDDNRNRSPNRGESVEPDFIYIPLKKSELNINLKYDSSLKEIEKISLEERVNPPDVIMEEELQHIDTDKLQQNSQIIQDILPISEYADVQEAEENIILPTTVDDKSNESKFQRSEPIPVNGNIKESCQSNLATLNEEEIPLESPPENFLQTATTCLIPVPVYECLSHEWEKNNSSDQWVDMASDEIKLNIESVDEMPTVLNQNNLIEEVNDSNDQQNDQLPIISVSTETPRDSIDETPSPCKEINLSRLSVERSFDELKSTNSDKLLDKPIEFTEVKKRYSNDETKIGDRSQSADSILPRGGNSADEKRRIDKSRRRKGMYIQWPALERDVSEISEKNDWNHSTESSSNDDKALTVDISKVDFSESSGGQTPGSLFLTYPPTDDSRTPGSICSFETSTPDSDYNGRPPIWPRTINRRTSLSCQSSEEKDDVPTNNTSSHRNQKTLQFFKNDSMSDNESDRTPPPSRDRTSPSPAPGEQDLKRYSKRPLRGPYGQMLEAEMKKPGKVQYDEILEELKDSEEFTKLTSRTRTSQSNRSFDNTRTIPQYSSSMRVRKSNAYLPVPAHTRAASTPSQMENISTNTPTSIDSINSQEKRYQSNLFDTTTSSDCYSVSGSSNNTIRTNTGQDLKNNSVENKSRDRSPKRASSEIPNIKSHPKRSSSTASERNAQDKQKRSLEEIRLSQSSRTPSERSMVSESGKSNNGGGSGTLVPTPELLAALLKGSSERQISTERQQMFADTRSHVVHEIFQHEQNYVDALNTVVGKYLHVLKTSEHAGMIDSRTVDEIFYMIPEILAIHEKFLNELQSRLDNWDSQQKVGDVFLETFSKTEVLETYTCYVNNCNRAEDAIRMTKQSRPSFAKFLAITASKHAGKLSLSNFLIKPVQKFPHYEMLFKRLIKNTDADHPDQKPLEEVLKLAKEISVHLDCKKKEVNENGQREATLKELENVIDGITELLAPERQFLGFETVSVVSSGQNARKDRGFFLFSDLLVLTSIKRIKKPNTTTYSGSIASTLDTNNNKYKFLIKVSLDNIEILKTKDESLRKKMNEIEDLISDSMKWQQICEITASLKSPHQWFEEKARDYLNEVQRTLTERQSNDTQLNLLEILINLPTGSQNLSIAYNKAEKRAQWEEMINEAKQKLAASLERHPIPEFKISIAICKTRAGLQFTCAAPILSDQKDVWVCNSDGYIGQVGILSINPEPPTVKICAGICNARILCVASVPAAETKSRETSVEEITSLSCRNSNSSNYNVKTSDKNNDTDNSTIKNPKISSLKTENNESDMQLDSNSSSDDSEPEGGSGSANSGSVASGTITSSGGVTNQLIDRIPSPAPTIASNSSVSTTTTATVFHQQQDSNSDETDCQQSTMWLGTEDGCIHVYNCNDNIRTKKNKLKIEHKSAVYSILYLDNRVFVSLANGDIYVYLRDSAGWNTQSPLCMSVGTVSSPVNKLLNVHGKLWCSIQGIIKIIDTKTLQVENQIQISSDSKPITNMVVCNNYVWISIQNSAHIKCFHSNSHELMFEINLAPSVNKMLSNCDDIIRQHKAACLRVTSLLACKDLIWIGTSAGVLLTVPAQTFSKGQTNNIPIVTGIPHGHTGHVRFLTCIDSGLGSNNPINTNTSKTNSTTTNVDKNSKRHTIHAKTKSETGNILIISGGDGYENFGNSGSLSEIAGREDSTNHLLIWQI